MMSSKITIYLYVHTFLSYHRLLPAGGVRHDLVFAGRTNHWRRRELILAVINSLRTQGIAFGGPFCSPGGRTVLVVESCIFLESELVDLFAQSKLNRDGIQGLV